MRKFEYKILLCSLKTDCEEFKHFCMQLTQNGWHLEKIVKEEYPTDQVKEHTMVFVKREIY